LKKLCYILYMSRVLLVDDDQNFLIALPAVFTRSPCAITVDTASSAEQALRLVQASQYDTIVSDFSMPGLNGIEFLKECKVLRPDIPIILLTGYGTLELEDKAFQEGAYAVVLKPVDVDVLLSVVTHAIIRRELDQAAPSDQMSSLSIDARTITAESKRLSSRMRSIDERLRRQIEDADKDQPG
jgi:DNA-binding NtrC family response regulator